MSLARRARVFVVLFLLAASSALADEARPTIKVRQLPRSEFDVEQRGALSVAYEMTIRNTSPQAITLRRVTMKTVGRSPYTLKNEAVAFDVRIEPESESTVTLSMWAYSSSNRKPRQTVWVRGNAHFDGEGKTFVVKFADSFAEPD